MDSFYIIFSLNVLSIDVIPSFHFHILSPESLVVMLMIEVWEENEALQWPSRLLCKKLWLCHRFLVSNNRTDFGLQQLVDSPTHEGGHILDLVITRCNDSLLTDSPVVSYFISDHAFVDFTLNFNRPAFQSRNISYRC